GPRRRGRREPRMTSSKGRAGPAALALGVALPTRAWTARVGEAVKQRAQAAGRRGQRRPQGTGAAIGRPRQDRGTPVRDQAAPAGEAIKKVAQQTGAVVEPGARDTGNGLDRSTKGFRDGAESFFKKVGGLFSSDK